VVGLGSGSGAYRYVRLADMSDSKPVSSDSGHDFPISYDLTMFVKDVFYGSRYPKREH
jgi:hypothetical protein